MLEKYHQSLEADDGQGRLLLKNDIGPREKLYSTRKMVYSALSANKLFTSYTPHNIDHAAFPLVAMRWAAFDINVEMSIKGSCSSRSGMLESVAETIRRLKHAYEIVSFPTLVSARYGRQIKYNINAAAAGRRPGAVRLSRFEAALLSRVSANRGLKVNPDKLEYDYADLDTR